VIIDSRRRERGEGTDVNRLSPAAPVHRQRGHRMLLDAGHEVVVLDACAPGTGGPRPGRPTSGLDPTPRVLTPDAGFDGVLPAALTLP
jgi:hypothetical protein